MVMAMATRVAGKEEGVGEGGKSNGDGDEEMRMRPLKITQW